jgi:hypothetical protein
MAKTCPHILKSPRFAMDIDGKQLNKAWPKHARIYAKVIDSLRTSIKTALQSNIFQSHRLATDIYQRRLNKAWPEHEPHILKSNRFATSIHQQWHGFATGIYQKPLYKAWPKHDPIYSNVIDSLRTSIKDDLTKHGPNTSLVYSV